jgi:hypothetical protein
MRVGIGGWRGVENNLESEKKNVGSPIPTMELA